MNATRPIGITQRQKSMSHGELRDCLAVDWYPFLHALGMPWLVLPNDPAAALEMAERHRLRGLILSGGDDIGIFPLRDETEYALLDWFCDKKLPIVGVCRGFQVLCAHLGGTLGSVDPDIHRARRHTVKWLSGAKREVNSYHNLAPVHLPSMLTPLAHCEIDGKVEAAGGEGLLGILWHPERESQPQADDICLLKNHLEVTQ